MQRPQRRTGLSSSTPTSRLLSQVNGQPWARPEDHDKEPRAQLEMKEEDILAEPRGSSEDELEPAPQVVALEMDGNSARNTTSFRDSAVTSEEAGGSSKGRGKTQPRKMKMIGEDQTGRTRRSGRNAPQKPKSFITPRSRNHLNDKVAKETATSVHQEDEDGSEKENEMLGPPNSDWNRATEAVPDKYEIPNKEDIFGFGYSDRPSKRRKRNYATFNVHVPTAATAVRTQTSSKHISKDIRTASQTSSTSNSNSKPGLKRRAKQVGYGKKSNAELADASESDEGLEPLPEVKAKSPERKKAEDSDLSDDSEFSYQSLKLSPPKPKEGKNRIVQSKPKVEPAKPAPNILASLANFGYNASVSRTTNGLDIDAPSGSSTPLSTPESAILDDHDESLNHIEQHLRDEEALELSSQPDICPVCRNPIPTNQFQDFRSAHPQLRPRDLRRFCREHQHREALEEYTSKNYPTIDWATFPKRIKRHFPRLEAVLTDTTLDPSHYRLVHEQRATKGKERTTLALLSSDKILESTTGYYGPRGARIMMEAITEHFSDLIRERMISDHVVRFGGIGNFVQRVLVPELSCCLVMEDFGVSTERAREIVDVSGACGVFVNPEVGDRVTRRLEEEDE